jgi:hypothetical protein
MAKVSAAQRKRIAEMNAKMRRGRVLQVKRNGKKDIPDKIMKQLGSLGPAAESLGVRSVLGKTDARHVTWLGAAKSAE